MSAAESEEQRAAADRLLLACEMFEVGVQLQRDRFQRENPEITPEQIEGLISQWLHDRNPLPPGQAAPMAAGVGDMNNARLFDVLRHATEDLAPWPDSFLEE